MLGVQLVPLGCFGDAHAEAQELLAAPLKVELPKLNPAHARTHALSSDLAYPN